MEVESLGEVGMQVCFTTSYEMWVDRLTLMFNLVRVTVFPRKVSVVRHFLSIIIIISQ